MFIICAVFALIMALLVLASLILGIRNLRIEKEYQTRLNERLQEMMDDYEGGEPT